MTDTASQPALAANTALTFLASSAGSSALRHPEAFAATRPISGVLVTARTLMSIAALVPAIGVIHRADVLLCGTRGGASSGLGLPVVMR